VLLLAREVRFGPVGNNYSVDENALSDSPLKSHLLTAQEVKTQM